MLPRLRRALPALAALALAFQAGAKDAAAPASLDWTDAALSAPKGAQALLDAYNAENSLDRARALLERNAPRLPSGEGRRSALAALGGLLDLSGDSASAADAWNAAAWSGPAAPDALCLLEAARGYLSAGDFDRSRSCAAAAAASPSAALAARGRVLAACAAAFAGEAGAADGLRRLLADPACDSQKPVLLFVLASVCSDAPSAAKLQSDYPGSPEALVAKGGSVSIFPKPFWLLSPGRAGFSLSAPDAVPVPAKADPRTPAQPGTAKTDSKPSAGPGPAKAGTPDDDKRGGGPTALQIGLFKTEENAKALAARLKAKGFNPGIAAKGEAGKQYWVVSVPPGKDAEATALKLKDSGFESFPLF